jgi:putative ABC transport system permease protein
MLINYLRIAFRNIRRNKLYSLINIGCLAIGIAVAMTILLYTLHEHSFDRFHPNADRIFAVSGTFSFGNSTVNMDFVSYPTGPLAKKEDGSVESYLRSYRPFEPVNLQAPASPQVHFTENKNFLFADSNFFQFFSFRLLRGDPSTVLRRPYTVVLSARAAKKYFGDSDPVGKSIRYNSGYNLEVTGISANTPSNSGITYDFVASLSSIPSMKEAKGMINSSIVQGGAFKTWLLLKNASASPAVERTLDRLSRAPGYKDNKDIYTLTALPDTHLKSNFGDSSNTRYLTIFPLVAGLILLLALVNYMSLATARAAVRAKEVGVRKVMGAGRGRIAGQFYTESAVYAILSFTAGALLFLLLRPWFFNQLQLPVDASFLLAPRVLLCFAGLLVLVIVIAGSYPALVLSSFNPVAVLYGRLSRRRAGEGVRKGFLVFQFTISMSLVLCSAIIGKELYFIRHTDTGISRDNVVMVPFDTNLPHYQAFKREVQTLPGIRQAATARYPMYNGYNMFFGKIPGSGKEITFDVLTGDDDFISLLGLRWREKPVIAADIYDGKHILLNETAVGKLGLSPDQDPIGQQVTLGAEKYTVAGVLKDFNYQSLQEKVGPLCLFVSKDTALAWGASVEGCLFAKIRAHANVPSVIGAIQKIYAKYDKQTAFEYQFMDDAFDSQYKAEDRLSALFGAFTAITIVIACLGLFALATFSAQQRVKEIGIRKVLGASIASIGALLSRDFLRPVLLSILIASPLSWWAMHRWLQDFAYRTSISWWIFPAAGGLLLLIAQISVLFRTVKAARANPVNNLRTE